MLPDHWVSSNSMAWRWIALFAVCRESSCGPARARWPTVVVGVLLTALRDNSVKQGIRLR